MGQVSTLEVEEERRAEAAHFGLLPPVTARSLFRVRTSLETTQDPGPNRSKKRLPGVDIVPLLRRARDKAAQRNHASTANMWRWPKMLRVDTNATNPTPFPSRRSVVVVERVAHRALNGRSELWLKIRKRNDERLSQRLPTSSDKELLETTYPHFFAPYSSDLRQVECLAEWLNGEWYLAQIFDPFDGSSAQSK